MLLCGRPMPTNQLGSMVKNVGYRLTGVPLDTIAFGIWRLAFAVTVYACKFIPRIELKFKLAARSAHCHCVCV